MNLWQNVTLPYFTSCFSVFHGVSLAVSLAGGQSSSTGCPLGKRSLGTWAPGLLGLVDGPLQLEAADAELLGAREQCEAVEKSGVHLFSWFLMILDADSKPKPSWSKIQDMSMRSRSHLALFVWSPSVLDSVSFCRFAADDAEYGIILQIITESHEIWTFSLQMCLFFLFWGSDGPHCEAPLSCCQSLSSTCFTSRTSRSMPCRTTSGVVFLRSGSLQLLGSEYGSSWNWNIPRFLRDKAQPDYPWWSMM